MSAKSCVTTVVLTLNDSRAEYEIFLSNSGNNSLLVNHLMSHWTDFN